ncbi:MAG: D-hexose-6-phosphate mutarotase [Propioniciclava sp.]
MAFDIITEPMRGVEARHGSAHYGIFDHGAHVWAYQPAGQSPVLWLSGQSAFTLGTPVRGGIPVVFPWFGNGRRGDLAPTHGFARTAVWHLSDTKDTLERDGRLLVEYELDDAMTGGAEAFPFPYTAYLRAKFTPEYLSVELQVTNTGTDDFAMDNALHTYLAVGDARQVTVSGLDGATYFDKVIGENRTQAGELRLSGETDRVYASTADVVVTDPVLDRTLRISKQGSANTVIWNPWEDRCADLGDLGDADWTSMICVEAANALGNDVTLRPGETHHLKQRISIA